ncbi:MAG: hypothetical protein ACON5B_18090 [Myxococcota bacterium]
MLFESEDLSVACADVAGVQTWAEGLAGRALTPGQRRALMDGLYADYKRDPQGAVRRVDEASAASKTLAQTGLPAALGRSKRILQALEGDAIYASEAQGDVVSVLSSATSIWEFDRDAQLVLTESDVEGWIRYASLCREAQGASALRVSIADRVTVYAMVRERFRDGTVADRQSLIQIGAMWSSIREGWMRAPYGRQQQWIREAPLPPPMMATSLGYLSALLETDLPRHAEVTHRVLGPLTLPQP